MCKTTLTISSFSVDNSLAHRHGYNQYGHSTDTERTQNVDTFFVHRRRANTGGAAAGAAGDAAAGAAGGAAAGPPLGQLYGIFYLY